MTPRRLAALMLPAILAIACVFAAPPQSQGERDPLGDNQYASGGNLRASWDQALVAEYAAIDEEVSALLAAALRESLLYSEYSAVVRGACDMLDDMVDFNKPDLGLNRVHSQNHRPEGRVAMWVFVKTGQSWGGYCGFHRSAPDPTPWPTPTAIPPAPLTVCMGWAGEGFDDDSSCAVGGTSVNRKLRVKILPEGQAGWLEFTYPGRPTDGTDSVLCGYPSATTGFHVPASQGPVFKPFETCAEGLAEFRWVPDEGEEYPYQLRVKQ